jgi:hypothetical protein
MLRRQRYTDSDVTVLTFRRVMAMTSVDPGALNGDLADRLVTVELERIPASARASEEDLQAQWDEAHAKVLGGLLDVAVQVLLELPSIQRTGLPRMADFALVLMAVDKVLGTRGYAAYTDQASSTAQSLAEGDIVVLAIREKITESFEGTATELLELLTDDHLPRDWPKTPQGLGGRLTRAAPTLRALGWTVEKLPRRDQGGTRRWRIEPPRVALECSSELSELSETSGALAEEKRIPDSNPATAPAHHSEH